MSGRRIFITGGASGLGRALAERFARAGFRVLIGDIHEARGAETVDVLRSLGAEANFLHCDVRQESDYLKAADWLDTQWGGVDIVINNAGVAVGGGIGETTEADWEWIVSINLLGVARGCRVFAPRLARAGGGHLVNIASMAGLIHPPLMAAYNATKAGVVALSETLDLELASQNVAVSVVCPSFFKTNLSETLRAGSDEAAELSRKLINDSKHSADVIAERVFEGIKARDFHILTHPETTAVWYAKRTLPHPVYRKLFALGSKWMMKR